MKCSLSVFALMMALFSAFHSASSAEFSLKTINVSVPPSAPVAGTVV